MNGGRLHAERPATSPLSASPEPHNDPRTGNVMLFLSDHPLWIAIDLLNSLSDWEISGWLVDELVYCIMLLSMLPSAPERANDSSPGPIERRKP